MATAWHQFIARNKRSLILGALAAVVILGLILGRSHSAAGQSAAFHLSEAGLHYALHLFNSGTCMPQELEDTTLVQAIPAENAAGILGTFMVTVDSLPEQPVTQWHVSARGRLAGRMGACQEIQAQVESFSGTLGTKYRLVSWTQHDVSWCPDSAATRDVICAGQVEK